MTAKEERKKKEYFTLGSYTTTRDYKNHTMTLAQADKVKKEAIRIAEFNKVKIKHVTGSGMKSKQTTPSLPAEIWQEAIDNILTPKK
jgi:hypothetical protein